MKFYQIFNETEEQDRNKQDKKREIADRRPNYQKVIWNLMEHPRSSNPAFTCALISIFTIVLSVIVICLETMPTIVLHKENEANTENRNMLFFLETTVMVWFTLEYILRIISAPRTFKFMVSFTGIIDLVVILPYYINIGIDEQVKSVNLAIFRILRMFRVFRVFKLTRYSTGLKVLGKTIIESFGQLAALFLCLFLSAILFSSCLYYIEHVDNPVSIETDGKKDVFISIPESFWYVIITMTSVGYGDVVPKTVIGRVVAAFCMVSGIIVLLCLPTPVFVTHFGRFYEDVISKPHIDSNEDNDEEEYYDSEIWTNHEVQLMVPTWVNDHEWKDKIRNDYNQNLGVPTLNRGLNVYLSTSNLFLSRTYSQEYLNQSQTTPLLTPKLS